MNTFASGMILHVDDEPSVRSSLAALLRTDGYDVHGAASGPEALLLASQGLKPDILIVDFNLDQDMNGAEVAEQIRRVLHYTPPIIMLTGDLNNAEFPAITEVPVWLTRKPLDPQVLLAALPGLVELSRATRAIIRG